MSIPTRWLKYIGVAASEIHDDKTTTLEVLCPEFTPMATGVVTADSSVYKVELQSYDGKALTRNVSISKTIGCRYIGRNNKNCPHIHLGEQVWVYNYAGTDIFYWAPTGRNNNNRKTEIVKIFAANRNDITLPLDETNTYDFILDSINKRIRIFTRVIPYKDRGTWNRDTVYTIGDSVTFNKKRYINSIMVNKYIVPGLPTTSGIWGLAELVSYDIDIDSATGALSVYDNIGNLLKIDSTIPSILAQNSSGTSWNLLGKSITATAPENVLITAGKTLALVAPNLLFNGTTALEVRAPNIGLNGVISAGAISATHVTSTFTNGSAGPTITIDVPVIV